MDPALSSTAAELSAIADNIQRTGERIARLAEPFLGSEREDVVASIYEIERSLLGAQRSVQRALRTLGT